MRKAGFNGADGEAGEAEVTANQAFNKYLDENGLEKNTQNKAKFKKWIEDRKADGTLKHIVKSNKGDLTKAVASAAPTNDLPTADSLTGTTTVVTPVVPAVAATVVSTKVFGLDPLLFGAICFVVGVIAYKAYEHTKK